MIILTRKSKCGSTSFNDIIFNDQPSNKSLASLLLLNDYYSKLDVYYIEKTEKLDLYLELRHEFLFNHFTEHGKLECHYCGKSHLEIGFREIENTHLNLKNKNLATIDHKIPRGKCSNILDTNNWLVACVKCNKDKGNLDYDEFMLKIKNNKRYGRN